MTSVGFLVEVVHGGRAHQLTRVEKIQRLLLRFYLHAAINIRCSRPQNELFFESKMFVIVRQHLARRDPDSQLLPVDTLKQLAPQTVTPQSLTVQHC